MVEVLTENHPRLKLFTSPQAGNCVLLACVVNDLCFNNEMSWMVLGHVSLFSFIHKMTNVESSDATVFTYKSEQDQNIGGTSEECNLHSQTSAQIMKKLHIPVSIKCGNKLQIEVLQLRLNLC